MDKNDFALFTAAFSLASKLDLSIDAKVMAFCNTACCLLFKFCSCNVPYLSASSFAIGIADSYMACVIADAAILDEPRPL